MKNIADQTDHAGLLKGGHDDRAAQDFAFTLRNIVTSDLMPANRVVYDRRVAPAFRRATGARAWVPTAGTNSICRHGAPRRS